MLNLPLQLEFEQSRPGAPLGPAAAAANSTACARRCNGLPGCNSWLFDKANAMCQVQSDAPLNRYTPGFDSGVRGTWQVEPDGRCVTLLRPGGFPSSGNASLCVVSGGTGVGATTFAARAHASAQRMLRDFAAAGDASITARGAHWVYEDEAAVQGTIQVTSGAILPGENATITLSFGWNFPARDHYNFNVQGPPAAWSSDPFGNRYSELHLTARSAAWAGESGDAPDAAGLLDVLARIDSLHSVVMSATSLPDWLQDHIVNSVSHSRDSLWFAKCPNCVKSSDPRVGAGVMWRQFEANDCPDLDSIHNDGERHIPYITLWPNAERSKMAAWAHNQLVSGSDAGMLAEQIHNADPDQPEGRRMADGGSAFIIEVLELLRWANDTTTLELYYGVVKQAVGWQINVSSANGVPFKLQTTYDILGFPQFDHCAYASVFHMAAMAAAAELAVAMDDPAFEATCRAALVRAQKAFDALQWNEAKQRYDAASSGCDITADAAGCKLQVGLFADTFYPQVLALSAGLGWLTPNVTRVAAHLASQLKRNCISFAEDPAGTQGVCPVGMVLYTGRQEDGGGPTGGSDLQTWEMPTAAEPLHSRRPPRPRRRGDAGSVRAVRHQLEQAGQQPVGHRHRERQPGYVDAFLALRDAHGQLAHPARHVRSERQLACWLAALRPQAHGTLRGADLSPGRPRPAGVLRVGAALRAAHRRCADAVGAVGQRRPCRSRSRRQSAPGGGRSCCRVVTAQKAPLSRRGIGAAPVNNAQARSPPGGPGSCVKQWFGFPARSFRAHSPGGQCLQD